MVFNAPINFILFKQRRKNLLEKIKQTTSHKKGVVIIMAGFETERHAFRQESSFYYLTGITEPAGILCMYLDGTETFYIPRFSTSRNQWVQVNVNGPEDAKRLEVDAVLHLGKEVQGYSFNPIFTQEKYEQLIKNLIQYFDEESKLFTLLDNSNQGYHININFFEHLKTWIPNIQSKIIDISTLVHDMRCIKDEYEIDLLYKAVQITNMAQRAAASMIIADKYEYEVQAATEYIFSHIAGTNPSFPSIIATGKNTTILHYTQRNQTLKLGDLVVVDIGAEYGFYAADLTRTYPVGGKFSPRQRMIYQMVLDTQQFIESIAVPGMYLKNAEHPEKSLHHQAVQFLEALGYAKYFCHGIGHYLGLDVHDVGDYNKALESGNVFTIEPGIYIPEENLGIRIEDDYIMADDGAVCLSYDLLKNPDDIERVVREEMAATKINQKII